VKLVEALIALIDEIIVITVIILIALGILFIYNLIDILTLIAIVGVYVLIVFIIGFKIAKSQLEKPKVGHESLIGAKGYVVEDIRGEGLVFVQGELWKARSVNGSFIPRGTNIVVVDVSGLVLIVKKYR